MGNGRKSYTLDFKLRVIERLHELGDNVSATARAMKVSRRVVDRCRNREAEIRHLLRGRKKRRNTLRKRRRLCKPGRPQFEDMEDELFDWITGKRDDGIAVHGKAIQSKAKEIVRSYYGEDAEFAASRGWLSRFLRRRKLVSRRVTTVGQEIPGNAADVAERFMSDVKKIITDGKFSDACIGNMDETPFWFDLPSTATIDMEGVKTVKAKTTGHEKLRFTVVLTALSSGRKLRPMIIFKNLKNVPKGNFPRNCFVTVAKGGSMTASLMLQYIDNVWKTRPGSLFRHPYTLGTCMYMHISLSCT